VTTYHPYAHFAASGWADWPTPSSGLSAPVTCAPKHTPASVQTNGHTSRQGHNHPALIRDAKDLHAFRATLAHNRCGSRDEHIHQPAYEELWRSTCVLRSATCIHSSLIRFIMVAEPGQLFRRPDRRKPSTAINTSGSTSPAYHQARTPTATRYIVLRPAEDDQDVIIREASPTKTHAKWAPQFQALSWLEGRDRQVKEKEEKYGLRGVKIEVYEKLLSPDMSLNEKTMSSRSEELGCCFRGTSSVQKAACHFAANWMPHEQELGSKATAAHRPANRSLRPQVFSRHS
jgi:hypothetical protein